MRKKFGQNFLVNPAARSRLIDALEIEPGDTVWEIGPGLGAMTSGLLAREAVVKAFEIDPAFSSVLKDIFGDNGNFSLVEGDVLKTWQGEAASEAAAGRESRFLLGNLPYNIAAALLADFIEKKQFFSRMVVTVQKEVALRMTARPGSKDYSSFSVLCASAYRTSPLAVIKGASFYPPPRVDSQGVRLDLLPREERACASPFFQPLVRCLFASRRKTIRNNLINFSVSCILRSAGKEAGHVSVSDIAEAVLASSGLEGERRAETLSIEDFAALAGALEKLVCHG
jgi:16S rRNA (adenine1518-N6/adenine1519-N6)-dimethyltransferase